MSLNSLNQNQNQNQNQYQKLKPTTQTPTLKKQYSTAVCIIPPEGSEAFTTIQNIRYDLRDTGYFRWPPHINLLYPFVETESSNIKDIIKDLVLAMQTVDPFELTLPGLGIFGTANRGVLFLDPETPNNTPDYLKSLQSRLEDAVPICVEQRQVGGENGFRPHMTITHLSNKDEAENAQSSLDKTVDYSSLSFKVTELVVMERKGHYDQFQIVYRIPLGRRPECEGEGEGEGTLFSPLKREPENSRIKGMPEVMEEWIREAMDIKRRPSSWKKKNSGSSSSSDWAQRAEVKRKPTTDTPEDIVRKRAERAAKREAAVEAVVVAEALATAEAFLATIT